MVRKRLFFILVAALTFVSWNDSAAQVSSDLGSWIHIHAVKSCGDTYAMARLEHRSYDRLGATECWFAMAGAGYRFAGWLSGDLSYEFWKLPVAGNATTHKAVASLTATLKREGLSVSMREKYELAFAEDGSTGGTIRSRLRAQYHPDASVFTPYLMYEFFNGTDGGWIRSLHYAGTDIRLNDSQSLEVYYMYHLYPRGTTLLSCNVLGLGYMLKF